MAYVAVISLKNTIHHFLNSSRISVIPRSRAILEFAHAELTSLQQVLERLDDRSGGGSRKLEDLDGRIREVVHKLEDVLEFHLSDQFSAQSSESTDDVAGGSSRVLSVDLEKAREELLLLYEMGKETEKEYVKGLEERDDDDDGSDLPSSSSIDFGVEMVGLADEYAAIKDDLVTKMRPNDLVVLPIFGRLGSGRTAAAKKVFDDLCVNGKEQGFDCGAWVSVGPNYQLKETLVSALSQINPRGNKSLIDEKSIAKYLYASLKGKRCMIVLDDVWGTDIVDYLIRCFPEQENGSVLMLTTSLKEFSDASYIKQLGFYCYVMTIFSEEAARDLFRLTMGYLETWPIKLDEAGMKIAKNTQECFVQVCKVVLYIWKANKLPDVDDENNPVFVVDDEISEIRKIKKNIQQLPQLVLDDNQRIVADLIIESLDFSDEVEQIKGLLFPKRFFPQLEINSFSGMAGIGKTTLVKRIFEDPSIFRDADHRVWITLGPKYQSKEILVDILAKIYPNTDKKHMIEDERLVKDLCERLSLKKCLIVLDDVWNQKPLHYLKKLFPGIKGKVLLTTRLVNVAKFGQSDKINEVRLLNEEESWCLFCHKVFAGGLCPLNLEKVGKKICESCEGLPLLILTVADLLSKVDKTPEYWNEVAKKKNSLFEDAHNEISKILLPSYKSLPQYLKAFFLYMGVFPLKHHIPVSKLNNLWNAEGFFELDACQNIQDFEEECILELANTNLVMVPRMSFRLATCHLHSVFWYLSTSEALKSTFFQALKYCPDPDDLMQYINGQRRLCIRSSILLSIKDVRGSIATILNAHSLICSGPPLQYEVPITFELKLLRVLDALTIRLYKFPIELVKLIHLRYLALTCDGKLPACISEFWSLQYLIVGRHFNIKSSNDSLCLPDEIWDMKELRHLEITGGCLPDPKGGDVLPNLLTLLGVSAQSCTERVFEGIPNVKNLGIQIELAPGGDGNLFNCLIHIWHLSKLESLECVVINPELRPKIVNQPGVPPLLPSSIKELSLSGLGYPWEYMSIIGNLSNLEVLNLRCYAFQGPKWEIIKYDHFKKVKFLSIEDTDLEQWVRKLGAMEKLEYLSFKHCYKLKKLPDNLPTSLEKVEIVDSNPYVVTWAQQMKERYIEAAYYPELLQVRSSWE